MAGTIEGNPTPKNKKPLNNSLYNQYNLYGKAVHGQQNDYDSIMNEYRKLLAQRQGNMGAGDTFSEYKPQVFNPQGYKAPGEYQPNTYKPPTAVQPLAAPENYRPGQYSAPTNYSPLTTQYKQSDDLTDAVRNLKSLSETGGYSAEGIADLRSRGISPIQSMYAGANRDIERNRAIQGSSASYGALKSRMTRELSDKVSGAVQNVNAGIAQNVASNKLQIAPTYAGVTGDQSNLQNRMNENNTGLINEANRYNAGNRDSTNRANTDLNNSASLLNLNRGDEYNRSIYDENKRMASSRDDVGRSNVDLINQANLYNRNNTDNTNRANTDLFNNSNKSNIDEQNRARQINMEIPYKRNALEGNQQNQLQQILEGMKSLYGTTPALANLFGSQAQNSASLQNNINQGNNNNSMEIIMNLLRQLSSGGRN